MLEDVGRSLMSLFKGGDGEGDEDREDEAEAHEGKEILTTCTIQVVSASHLLKADLFGESDPFVVARFGGVRFARSRTKQDTLHPEWKEGEAEFTVTMPENPSNMNLCLELWDEDFGGLTGDFLGCVEIGVEMLLHPFVGEVTFALKNRRGWVENSKKPITGTVTLRINKVKARARTFNPTPPPERKVARHEFGDTSVIIAHDSDKEDARFRKDAEDTEHQLQKLANEDPERAARFKDEKQKISQTLSKVKRRMMDKTIKLEKVALERTKGGAGAMQDGSPVITEIGAGQIIGESVRGAKDEGMVRGAKDERAVSDYKDLLCDSLRSSQGPGFAR